MKKVPSQNGTSRIPIYGNYPPPPKDVKNIILDLRDELDHNILICKEFLPNNVDLDMQLKDFEENKIYDNDICDIFMLAFCNCCNIKIVIAEGTDKGVMETRLIIEPNNPEDVSFTQRTFFLLRSGDHYDPIVYNNGT